MRVLRKQKARKVRRSVGRRSGGSLNATGSFNASSTQNSTSMKCSDHQRRNSKKHAKRLRRISKSAKKRGRLAKAMDGGKGNAALAGALLELQSARIGLSNTSLRNADDVPTTSAQAAAAAAITITASPPKKFKKFLDNSEKKQNKVPRRRVLKRLNSSNTSTSSQIVTRRLLRSIKRRQNQKLHHLGTSDNQGKDLRRRLNFAKNISAKKNTAPSQHNKSSTSATSLEEGEIVSDYEAKSKTNNAKKSEDEDEESEKSDGDDCVCIEPQVDLITIDDETDPTPVHFHAIVAKNTLAITSTPNVRLKNSATSSTTVTESPSYASVIAAKPFAKASTFIKLDDDAEPPLFFKDTSCIKWLDTITSDDTFADYTKLTTLRGGKPKKRKRSLRLKEKSVGSTLSTDAVGATDDVILIDDFTLKPTLPGYQTCLPSRKKRKSSLKDDSVIFVSESNPNELPIFIPLESDDVPNPIRMVPNPIKTPKQKRAHDELFTRSEKKQLNEYNNNAYNPSAGEKGPLSSKRMVIIDGSNVAFNHALNKEFSVKGLKICLDYFEKMGHEVKAVVPQFRLNKYKSSEPDELNILHRSGKIVLTPCKNLPGVKSTSYDDRFVLQLACELDAAIVSNDNYRDLIEENSAFKKIIENRVIGYTWCNDIFILPKDPYGKWGPSLQTILNR